MLDSAAVRRLLDLSRPVAVMLLAVLHFCAGDVTPIVDAYKRRRRREAGW